MKTEIKITVKNGARRMRIKGPVADAIEGLVTALVRVLAETEIRGKLWNDIDNFARAQIARKEQKELEDEGESREADINADK